LSGRPHRGDGQDRWGERLLAEVENVLSTGSPVTGFNLPKKLVPVAKRPRTVTGEVCLAGRREHDGMRHHTLQREGTE
jgi:hypothetical protein